MLYWINWMFRSQCAGLTQPNLILNKCWSFNHQVGVSHTSVQFRKPPSSSCSSASIFNVQACLEISCHTWIQWLLERFDLVCWGATSYTDLGTRKVHKPITLLASALATSFSQDKSTLLPVHSQQGFPWVVIPIVPLLTTKYVLLIFFPPIFTTIPPRPYLGATRYSMVFKFWSAAQGGKKSTLLSRFPWT